MNSHLTFIHQNAKDRSLLFQDKLFNLFLLVATLYSGIYVITNILIGQYFASICLFIYFIASLLTSFLFRRKIWSYAFASTAFSILTLLFFLPVLTWFTGGIDSVVIWWFAIIPVCGLLLFGRSPFTKLCTVVSCCMFTLFALASHYHLTPLYQSKTHVFELVTSGSGLVIITYHLTRIFESQKSGYSKALSEEQDLLVKYTQMVPGVIYQFQANRDGSTRYPYISQGVYELLELTPEEVKKDSQNLFDRMHPDDFETLKTTLLHSARTKTIWQYECRMHLPQKGTRWMKGSAVPERQEDGSTIWYGHIYDVTEEKKTMVSLEESESNFKHISETIDDLFYLYDIIGQKYLYISPNCKKILGVDDSFFYNGGSYTRDYVLEEDRERMLEANRLVDSGIPYEVDFRINTDGNIRWVKEKSFPIKDEHGVTVKNSGIVTDITDWKRNKELLQQSEAKFREIFEHTFELIQNVSLVDGRFIYVNPAWLKTLEYTEAETAELRFIDIIHPESKEHCLQFFNMMSEKPQVFNDLEITFISKSGKTIYVEGQVTSIFQDGKPATTRGLFRDITTRKLANEELLKSRIALEEAQELAKIGNWEVSLFNNEVTWSKEMYRILDMEGTPKEKIAQAYKERVHPDDWKIMEKTIEALITKGGLHTAEVRVVTRAGETKYIMVIAEAIRSKRQQKIIGIKGTLQDITRQKKADIAKNEFLSTMSHEIRTPINGVIGIANLLRDETLTPVQEEYVNTLRFSADHLLTIVSDILDFSKIESGTFTFEKVSFNLEQVCQRVFKLFESKAKEKGIGYHFKPVSIENFSLYGDYVRLSQVLSNLLSNAVKFTHTGDIDFSYTILKETDHRIALEFIVKDTGIGISSDRKEKIFESFSQADNTVTRQYGGTGLGLTISKRLVELQGGTITVNSEPGMGSAFIVRLSFDKHAFHNAPAFPEEKSYGADSLQGIKVLVAEDNKVNAMVLTRLLSKWGAEFTVAEDGQYALDYLNQHSYDIILMDLQMPRLDGRAATQRIRESKDKKIREIPVVAITADALLESHLNLRKTGFTECITKPFNPEQLFKLLKKYHN